MSPEITKVRLQKFLSLNKISSRRKAEELIADGQVTVNGKVAEIGMSVDPVKDIVSFNGSRLSAQPVLEKKVPTVIMLNKPCGYLCTHSDPTNTKTVFYLLPKKFSRDRMLYCGRLDKDTQGMLIFTNDGDFAQKLTHPSSDVQKKYEVVISRALDPKLRQNIMTGILDDGEILKFEKLISTGKGTSQDKMFEVVLKQGHKNEIKRVFEKFGYFVKHLRRVQIGKLYMKGIAIGNCRKLTPREVELLFK